MTTPIQPTAVYPPGGNPYTNYGAWSAANPAPPVSPPGRITRAYYRIPDQNRQVSFRQGTNIPPILTNRSIVFNAWIVSMILVGFDEWHNLGILPRPARLWDTSLAYGLLMMTSFIDIMVPIANAIAIGLTVTLMYQYYQGNLTPAGNAQAQAQATIQPVGYQGTATVPATATTTGANPTGGAPTQTGA